ncbi:MAG: DNA internalization-related competence protein ComEC/Rec2 [Bryobacterales bacterium]|nr:DNA internalization-related competence protein ComEC/Rec2 [Bryobacterales bacterium]
MPWRLRDPLVPVFLALAGGVVAARLTPAPPVHALTAPLAGGFVLLAACAAARWRCLPRAAWAAGLAALLCLGVALETYRRPGPPPVIEFEQGETLTLAGCVVEPVAQSPDREQMVVELAAGARVRVNWYLKEGESAPGLRYGQAVELDAKLRRPRNYGNPGAFDFVHYLARRDIYWTATANAKSPLKVTGACGQWPLSWIYGAREAAIARLDQLYAADPYSRGMTRALLLGDTAMLERVWAEDFRRTGTYHALVISGLHLTLLTGWFLFFLRVVSAGVVWSLLATTLIAWIYTAMAGGGAPVARAAAGLTLYLLGRCLFRQPRVLNLLAAVALGYLLIDPDSLFDASFQLSFLSVAMIGAVAAPLLERTLDPYARGLRKLGERQWDVHLPPRVASLRVELRLLAETARLAARLPERATRTLVDFTARGFCYCASLLTVSAVVQAGLMLPMVAYFHRLSVTGLTANLAIVPLMNAVVLLGFGAIATGSAWLAWAAAVLLGWTRTLAAWHAAFEPPVRLADPPTWLIAAFLTGLILLWLAVELPQRRRWVRIAFAAPWCGCLGLLVAQPFAAVYETGHLEVTTLDVGQGDGILAGSPRGRFMLVDAGGFPVFGKRPTRPPIDVGEEVVSPYLFHRGIRQVDVVAVTHAHEDHIGGLRAVVENFRPSEVWTGAFPPTPEWTATAKWLAARGVKVRAPKAGETIAWDGVEVRVLSPPADYTPATQPKNNDSLVLHLTYGVRSILLTGDVERQMEARLVDSAGIAPADILKVAHHGSKSSTTDAFLDAVRPKWAVVSAGEANLFGHPHQSVLDRLAERHIGVYRTDTSGQVRMLTNGQTWRIETFQAPAAVTRRVAF